jgi:hypothetical protein
LLLLSALSLVVVVLLLLLVQRAMEASVPRPRALPRREAVSVRILDERF